MSGKPKETPIFKGLIHYLGERFSKLPDCRVGDNKFIQMKDVGLSAFSVFFNQYPSFLQYQRVMERREGRCNAQSLFQIEHIPSDNHIRHLLDPVPVSELFPVFDYALTQMKKHRLLDGFRWMSDQLLLAVDGLHYFNSKEISCGKCHQAHHKDGSISYSHSMVTTTLVHPERSIVIPFPPEFIVPQDGHEKQDCERAAFTRWLEINGKQYSTLKTTLLGDDLYACHPICKKVLEKQFHFIFTCKPESHKFLYEWVEGLERIKKTASAEGIVLKQKKKYRYHCRYINEVPIKNNEEALIVNWCSVQVFDEQDKQVYKNAFITDHKITEENVVAICQAGRTRWKIENEHNNTLKNHGYHLAHNFGHGKEHLASVLATLILLSFLFHNLLILLDKRYQMIREELPRKMFFQHLRTVCFYMYFASWEALMERMFRACELELDSS